jgi:hypothetical protein
VALGVAAAALAVWAVPGQAQEETTTTEPAPATNFSMAGIKDPSTMTALAVDKEVSGDFQFCNNANGLGAELYLSGGDGAGMTVRHATVTPFVVPLHIGVLDVNNPDPDNEIDSQEFLTIGVAKGTPIEFGQSGTASVEYGGIFLGKMVGLVNWTYSGDTTCTESKVMPILTPLIQGDSTTTTEVPTTEPPTTEAPTTEPPTTEAPTTEPPTTDTTVPGP